jgi:hypothetical protein
MGDEMGRSFESRYLSRRSLSSAQEITIVVPHGSSPGAAPAQIESMSDAHWASVDWVCRSLSAFWGWTPARRFSTASRALAMSARSFFKSRPAGFLLFALDFFVRLAADFFVPLARAADVFRDPLRVFATEIPP